MPHKLTKKNRSFLYTNDTNKAFLDIEKAFTYGLFLAHGDPQKLFDIEAYASNFALGSILSQEGDDGKVKPEAFHSRKFATIKINYEVHNNPLLAIVDSFEQ